MKNYMHCALAILLGVTLFGVKAAAEPSEALKMAMLVEDAFSEVVDNSKDAVVTILNKQYRRAPQMMGDVPPDLFMFPQFRGYRRQMPRNDDKRLITGGGSGVIIDEKGYIVTNNHVIKDYDFLEVKLADGTVYDTQKDKDAITVVGVDEESDLAVLQIGDGKKKFHALTFADSSKLRIGQWAIAIGAPFDLEHSVTIGHISQKERQNMHMSAFDDYIQTDASINPGNSGGPLLNIKGEIIGINQFIVTGGMSRGNVGLGFSISSNLVKQIVNDLIQNGEVNRPFLGISMQEMTDELREQFNVDYGVIVSEALPDTAAEKAGVKAGDVIQKVGGKKVNSPHEMLLAVTAFKIGDKIHLDAKRGDKDITFDIVAGKRDTNALYSKRATRGTEEENIKFDKLGLELMEKDGRVSIEEILPDGAVAAANSKNENGIAEGDFIIEVNRLPIRNVDDVIAAMKASHNNTVVFLIERKIRGAQPRRFFVAIPIKD
ncbi:MAG: trypsin-like peptidase domain-containing protein [Victivallales bacterium]|nr:trypsin-like peptidase domain-containing protein [Victivallales bacterium]